MNTVMKNLSQINNLMPFLFVFFLYFLVIRPQQKKEKKRQEMIAGLKKGDVVLTTGGIKGDVEKVLEKDIIICVSKGVNVTFSRGSVSYVVNQSKDGQGAGPITHPPASSHKKKGGASQNTKKRGS